VFRSWVLKLLGLKSQISGTHSFLQGESKLPDFCFVLGFFLFVCLFLPAMGLTLARKVLLLLEPLYQPFLVKGFFEIKSWELLVLGWLWSLILLISVSWEARITGLSICIEMDNETCWNYSGNGGVRKIKENDGGKVFNFDIL
jgi:hypothetical protein